MRAGEVGLAVLGLEAGFETDTVAVIGEQDILGDRLVRPHATRARRRLPDRRHRALPRAISSSISTTASAASSALKQSIRRPGAPAHCLEILYAGNDRVYLPVENIELLSRYGSEEADVQLGTSSAASPGSRARRG